MVTIIKETDAGFDITLRLTTDQYTDFVNLITDGVSMQDNMAHGASDESKALLENLETYITN